MKIPSVAATTSPYTSGESYNVSYSAGTLTVRGTSPAATLAGECHLRTAAAAGMWSEFLGECSPRFKLRPLCLTALPSMSYEELAKLLIGMGYNALATPRTSPDLHKRLSDWGIKLIASGGPDEVHADYLLYQASGRPAPDPLTLGEAVREELAELEQKHAGRHGLIFAVEEGAWLPELCDAAGPQTLIAFSCTAGNPGHHHLPPNPFWNHLRSHPVCTQTPLLGMVNLGSPNSGSGEWPMIPFDLFERYTSPPAHANFLGMMLQTDALPLPGTFHECSLWVWGGLQWRKAAPEQLIELWFKAKRPDIDYHAVRRHMVAIRSIALDLGAMMSQKEAVSGRRELWQLRIDQTLASLKRLEWELGEETNSVSPSSLVSSTQRFIRDALRILGESAQRHDLNFRPPNLLRNQ